MAVSANYKPEIFLRPDGNLFVPLACWKNIRGWFTEEEKTALNKAIVSEVICPAAVILDHEVLGHALTTKLQARDFAGKEEPIVKL